MAQISLHPGHIFHLGAKEIRICLPGDVVVKTTSIRDSYSKFLLLKYIISNLNVTLREHREVLPLSKWLGWHLVSYNNVKEVKLSSTSAG